MSSPNETRVQALRRLQNKGISDGTPYQELFDLMKTASIDEAQRMTQWIRAGRSTSFILREIRGADSDARLFQMPYDGQKSEDEAPGTSEQATAPAVVHWKQRGRQSGAAAQELLRLLRDLPDQEARSVLQKFRSGIDVTTILNHVRAGDVLLQMAVSPETRFRYEFSYRPEMPESYATSNPYMDSLIYEAASLYSTGKSSSSRPHTPLHFPGRSIPEEHKSLYLKPFHAAQVVNPRLSDVRVSAWTAVCDDDMLLRDLLRVFFRCEYEFTAAFQKDYFLEDMASNKSEFCSSLLVNVVLAYSCVRLPVTLSWHCLIDSQVCYPHLSNRAEYWNPHTLTYRFFAEAKRIWELEASEPRITTVQSGILFSVFYNLCALDEIGQPYRIHAVALAHKLRLFDSNVPTSSDRTRNGRAFTAWTLFNWET